MRLTPAFALAILLSLMAHAAFAQDTETIATPIDGITRTVTITHGPTGTISVEVAPLTSTFATTATAWLDRLYAATDGITPGTTITGTDEAMATLLDETSEGYPAVWTPFVRSFRFAVHSCRSWVDMHEAMGDDMFSGLFWFMLRGACIEQYQDAYVEMERVKYWHLGG